MAEALEIYISFARKDEKLLDMLLKALEGPLKLLKQQGLISLWHERDIKPGAITSQEVQKRNYSGPHFVSLELPATASSSDKLNNHSHNVKKRPLNDYYLINREPF